MASSDAVLLHVLKDKGAWLRFNRHIKPHTVSKECHLILEGFKDYYGTYTTEKAVDWDVFESLFFLVKAKHLKEDAAVVCRKMLADAKGLSHSPSPATDEVIKHYIKLAYAYEIMDKATSICTSGSGDLDVIEDLIQQHDKEVGKVRFDDEDVFVSTKLSEVLKSVSEDGLKWRLNELNRSLGPVRTGDFIIVAARPETGKTTFLASELSNWAMQIDSTRPIIWVNNEERSDKVMSRVIQSYFGITNAELFADKTLYEEKYEKEVGSRIRIVDNAAGMNDIHSLDKLFANYNPRAIVFDQLDKVHGYSHSDRDDIRLGKLYNWARDKAHQYGPAIAISQATGDDYSKWIKMSDLRGSKTDKAGEADAIITIGREEGNEYGRFIHVPKNKLFGGPSSIESERHAYYEVEIQPTIGRYKGVF